MRCEDLAGHLLDFLDNELPYSLRAEVEEHLVSCTDCRKEVEAFRKSSLLLQLRSVPEPKADYWEKTWERVQAGIPARVVAMPAAQSTGAARPRSEKRRWLAAAIAAVLVGLASGAAWYAWEESTYAESEFEYTIVVDDVWQPGAVPTPSLLLDSQFDARFSAYSKAAVGGIDPLSKSAVIRQVEALNK